MKDTILKFIGGFVVLVFFVICFGLLMAWPVKILWNSIVVFLFGFKMITVFQAWELLILCGFLFKSGSSAASKSK